MTFETPTNGHAEASVRLSDETRAFVRELFQSLAASLRPAESRWFQEQAAYVAGHLAAPEAEQTRLSRRFPAWAVNTILVAVDSLLRAAPYRLHEVVDFGYEGRCAPTYRPVHITPDQARDVLGAGWYAVYQGDIPLAVQVEEQHVPTRGLMVTIRTPSSHKELGTDLLQAIEAYPHFYRTQVISVDEEGNPSFLNVPPVAIDDVILDPDALAEIRRQVLDFVPMEAAFRAARLPFRRGVILSGPPGVGKTLLFRALTHELTGQCTVLWLSARSIPEPASVARVFELAHALAPTLMLWEDVDLTVRDRRGGNTAVLGELLTQLDGASSSEGVIVCASTNDPSVLDEALSARPSRFDRIVFIGPPSEDGRLRMLEHFVANVPLLNADLPWVAREAVGLTGADLRELVVTAFAEAQLGHTRDSEPANVETRHFAFALQQLAAASATARRSGVRRRAPPASVNLGFS